MVNLTTNFCGISFQNPISTCSGTYGFGIEYGEFLPVEKLGSVGTKGLTLYPRQGNPGVRIMETPAGMLNCIGLENPGAKGFVQDILPEMRSRLGDCKIIANISGDSLDSYSEITKILSSEEGIAALEVNISCPNVKAGGMAFGVNCDAASEVCRVVKEMKDGAILCNAGHFDLEINMEYLNKNASSIEEVKPNITSYKITPEKKLYVLAEGRLVNLASGNGHPAEIMDLTFGLQILSLDHLRLHSHTPGLYNVPDSIDYYVAQVKLNTLGVDIDAMTSEQMAYLRNWKHN